MLTTLTFGTQVAIECPMFSKAPSTLVALEGLLSGVMADVTYKRAFLPETPQAELAHIRLFLSMGALVYLQGILGARREEGKGVCVCACVWGGGGVW